MILCGDALTELKKLDSGIVQTCITSPPYWGLRDYGVDGQIGLESTPEEYVSCLVEIFAEVKRVLRDDGTLWLVLGDSYSGIRGNKAPAPDNKHPHVAADLDTSNPTLSRSALRRFSTKVDRAVRVSGECGRRYGA